MQIFCYLLHLLSANNIRYSVEMKFKQFEVLYENLSTETELDSSHDSQQAYLYVVNFSTVLFYIPTFK